ncbi:MAG: hypothetical protein AAGA56_26590 [Myxococcota bacterium]
MVRWIGLALLLLAIGCREASPEPGQEAFFAASQHLDTFDGEVGFGAEPTDERLARAFAREAERRAPAAATFGTTGGHTLAFVKVTEDAVLVLTRVPVLARDPAARETMMRDVLWPAARETLGEVVGDKTLVIAVRSALFYSVVGVGSDGAPRTVRTDQVVDPAALYGFFTAQGSKIAVKEPH